MPMCLEMPFEIYHLRWFQIRIAAALENMPMHLKLPFEICLLRLFQIMLDLALLAIKFWAETFKSGFCVLSHLQRIWPFWDFGIVIWAEAMNQIHVYDRFMNHAHWCKLKWQSATWSFVQETTNFIGEILPKKLD